MKKIQRFISCHTLSFPQTFLRSRLWQKSLAGGLSDLFLNFLRDIPCLCNTRCYFGSIFLNRTWYPRSVFSDFLCALLAEAVFGGYLIESVMNTRTKSVTVVDTIPTTVIFYLLPFREDSVEVPLLRDCHGGEQLITGERTNDCSNFVS